MLATCLFLTILSICSAQIIPILFHESEAANKITDTKLGAEIARLLVQRESLMNVNTLQQNSDLTHTPVSFMEYFADCDGDGDPYWLVVDIGTSFRNINMGSLFSFTIRAGDHPTGEKVSEEYPGGISSSPAGSPRINFKAQLQEVKQSELEVNSNLEKCFLSRHPDSKWWLPSQSNSPHKTHWVKLIVEDIYFIGGFGDRAYIGPITSADYHNVL